MEELFSLLNAANLRLIHTGPAVLCLNEDECVCVKSVALEDGKFLAGLEVRDGCLPMGEIVLTSHQWDRLLSLLNFG